MPAEESTTVQNPPFPAWGGIIIALCIIIPLAVVAVILCWRRGCFGLNKKQRTNGGETYNRVSTNSDGVGGNTSTTTGKTESTSTTSTTWKTTTTVESVNETRDRRGNNCGSARGKGKRKVKGRKDPSNPPKAQQPHRQPTSNLEDSDGDSIVDGELNEPPGIYPVPNASVSNHPDLSMPNRPQLTSVTVHDDPGRSVRSSNQSDPASNNRPNTQSGISPHISGLDRQTDSFSSVDPGSSCSNNTINLTSQSNISELSESTSRLSSRRISGQNSTGPTKQPRQILEAPVTVDEYDHGPPNERSTGNYLATSSISQPRPSDSNDSGQLCRPTPPTMAHAKPEMDLRADDSSSFNPIRVSMGSDLDYTTGSHSLGCRSVEDDDITSVNSAMNVLVPGNGQPSPSLKLIDNDCCSIL